MRQPWTGLRDRTLPRAPATLFPLRPSHTLPCRRRLAVLARLAVAPQPDAGPWASPCTDSQKGIFKAGFAHCFALSSGAFRS